MQAAQFEPPFRDLQRLERRIGRGRHDEVGAQGRIGAVRGLRDREAWPLGRLRHDDRQPRERVVRRRVPGDLDTHVTPPRLAGHAQVAHRDGDAEALSLGKRERAYAAVVDDRARSRDGRRGAHRHQRTDDGGRQRQAMRGRRWLHERHYNERRPPF